jgi:hypothetical protein
MKNKPLISPFTWLFMGFAAGLVAMFIYQSAIRQKYAREVADADLYHYLNRRAFDAYSTESKPVAIYAISEYLANLDQLRDRSYSYMAMSDSSNSRFQAHALLARLYAESGETNLSAQHLKLALGFAGTADNPSISSVTNQATLWSYIDQHY